MPLQDDMQIVSVDDHLVEHPRVWQDRLPDKFKEAGPKIIEHDGKHMWQYEDQVYPNIGLNAVAGKPPAEWGGLDPVRYEDMLPGCYDPKARIPPIWTSTGGSSRRCVSRRSPDSRVGCSFAARTKSCRCCASRRGTTSTSTNGAPRLRAGSFPWR